jgi:ubiquinone/menaquinone biosynthesis C-methylase UbiE
MDSLYNNFQLKVINDIISMKNNSSYLLNNNKNNLDQIDESIIDDILSNKYMSVNSLNTIRSMFNEIILYNKKTDQQTNEIVSEFFNFPQLNQCIGSVLNSFSFVSNKQSSEGYTLLSNFKSIKDLLVIKTSRREVNDLNILFEYFIGSMGINKLRTIIPNFCYTLSIFKHNALSIIDNIPPTIDIFFSNKEEKKEDTRFYVVYERIKGMSLADFVESIKTKEDMDNLISYLVQIVFAIKVAQDEIGFVHYDLHSDNILLRPLDEIVTVEYIINNKVYKIKTNAIPTIIDYGLSHFQYKDIQFGIINRENTGINSTRTPKGYDLYKLFHFVLMSVLFGNSDEEKFNDISWILQYYEYHYNNNNSSPQKEDPYGIYKAFYDMTNSENWSELGDYDNIKLAFSKGRDNYFSLTENTPLLYNDDPMSFINWMELKYPLKFKQFIESVSDVVHKESSSSIIAKKYRSKIDLNRIFNINVIDDIVDCDILNQKNNTFHNKSYIINKYITKEFITIIDIFRKNIKDVEIVKEKVKEIDQQNEVSKAQYQENDIKLFRIIKEELETIYKNSDIKECIYRLSVMRNTLDIKILNRTIEDFVTYNYIYESKYKKFIHYSMSSNRLYIDEDLEQFYIQSKMLCSQFSIKKSEHIFNWFRITLDVIRYFIYNSKENNYNNLPKIIDRSFEQSLHSIQNLFNDIKYFYPTISYAYQEIEELITNTILNIGLSHNTFIYLFTKSLFQIRQTYLCDNKRLTSLVMKSLRRDVDSKTIDTILKSSLDHQHINDISIYNMLRPYANKGGYDKDKRSKSRIKHLQFLFRHNLFKNIRSNGDFKYLDLGGWDGTITEEVGKYMRLSKKDIINADVDDWVNQIDENERNTNITFVPINNTGKLPFETSTFSLITAFQVFHHIEEIDDRLSELSRIIKKDGLLVIREHDADSDCTSMLADIEHSMYEMVLKENPSVEYLNTYKAYYKPMHTWNDILEYYGFEYIKNAKYNTRMNMWNPSRTYYAMYRKR